MAKSYVSDSNRSDGSDRHTLEADTHKGSRARSDRPGNLVFYLVTSILLHSVLFLGSDYWLRAFAPKQELSEPIPIEYVEVPPNKTNTPPKTSRRAAIDSVAGGKAKPERSISNAKPALTTVPKTSNTSTPSEVSQPEQTQQAIISSNPPPQNLQPKPQKIAIVPVTKPLAEASPTASKPKLQPPVPEASPTATKPLTLKLRQPTVTPEAIPPEPQASPTATKPTTKPLAFKLRQPTVTPEATPPEPQVSPTATKPTTKPLAFKLRQPTVTPEATPPEPQVSPTATKPTTKPLAFKLRQPTVTPEATASVPQASPTASKPTTKPLAFKLRQPTVTPEATASVPQASPTASKPTTKPLAFKLRQPTVTPEATASEAEPSPTISKPTPKLPKQQPSPTAVVPTKPLALKPQQTVVTSATTPPVPLTRRENRERLAAKSSSEQLENRMNSSVSEQTRSAVQSPAQKQPTTSRKLSGVQPSSKVGRASSLGGPIRVSNRDLGSNNLAALPNSNRLNPATQGIDARQDADIGAYVQQLQELVKLQWIPGLTQSSQRTVLVFTVSRAGLVSNLRVAQSSGFSTTDEAALSAVKRAAPFAPFPTAYTENYINIQFTFNINVYGQLELGSDDR
ncbi:TonB family protein [Brasilonema sp. UFV-L1]|uniref:TonB family protein n=1 Tax=Brasilonema sp. UFV-L1 TaxID=2234130 RepID=UPI00145E461B|nr:TonB family protein [Brasilonema sp. UFV-L1]NMG06881.1 hypothetical protein [Brasilonema sp. UFV-L1]